MRWQWSFRLLCPEQLPSPSLSPAWKRLNSLVKTPKTDLTSGEIQHPSRGERSASRREEVCREWASISSFFLLFLGVKRMCNPAAGTTTRTVVGQRHGKHSSEKTSIAMWPRTNTPTQGRESFCRCIHGGSEAPTSLEKKAPLCLWNPIWHSWR